MSNLFRYLLSAEQVVSTLLRSYPEDEAMARAVGGDYERIGVLEHAVLRELAGLKSDSMVVDVGCGSGRLAVQLARHQAVRYLGTDVVPMLLEYARKRANRPDFRFINVDRVGIPAADGSADIVCFFSVLTHLLHEESFLYLQEAARVLRPGGRIVFSFLEYDTPTGWSVFEANLDWVRTRVVASQINVFMQRSMIRLWAQRLGLRVVALRGGEQGSVTVGAAEATAAVPAGAHAFGQSLCVLRKPVEGEPEEPAPERATDAEREARRARRLARAAAGTTGSPGKAATPKTRAERQAAAGKPSAERQAAAGKQRPERPAAAGQPRPSRNPSGGKPRPDRPGPDGKPRRPRG